MAPDRAPRSTLTMWLGRLAWVAVGVLVHAVWLRACATETAAPDEPIVARADDVDTPAPTPSSPPEVTPPEALAKPDAGVPMTGADVVPSEDGEPDTVEQPEPVVAAEAEPAADPEPDPEPIPRLRPRPRGKPPSISIPRMPGTNQLRAGSKWDGERGAWVLTHAYEIPAKQSQVAAFYRKALEDASLEVNEVMGAPDAEGVVPLFLKGRKSGEHAHVTVRQEVDELRTRVRVIWRVFVEAQG